jgi:hypothetical protein
VNRGIYNFLCQIIFILVWWHYPWLFCYLYCDVTHWSIEEIEFHLHFKLFDFLGVHKYRESKSLFLQYLIYSTQSFHTGIWFFNLQESLVNLFFHCPHVRLIWLQVAHCLQTKCNIDFAISPEICILGVLTGQHFNILNTLIVSFR